jgi:hypothetical protein
MTAAVVLTWLMVAAVVTGFSIRRKARGSDVLYTVPLIDGWARCKLCTRVYIHIYTNIHAFFISFYDFVLNFPLFHLFIHLCFFFRSSFLFPFFSLSLIIFVFFLYVSISLFFAVHLDLFLFIACFYSQLYFYGDYFTVIFFFLSFLLYIIFLFLFLPFLLLSFSLPCLSWFPAFFLSILSHLNIDRKFRQDWSLIRYVVWIHNLH